MYFVQIDNNVFTLSPLSLKHFTVLNEIAQKGEYNNETSDYINYDVATKTFIIDADYKTFAIFVGSVRKNPDDMASMSEFDNVASNVTASRVGFSGFNLVGGLQVLSDGENTSDGRESPELILTELTEDHKNESHDSSKIFLKNVKRPMPSNNTMSSIGFTDGLSTVARSTESYVKPRRVLVNE